jgi:hypothetical protein
MSQFHILSLAEMSNKNNFSFGKDILYMVMKGQKFVSRIQSLTSPVKKTLSIQRVKGIFVNLKSKVVVFIDFFSRHPSNKIQYMLLEVY